MVEHLKAAGLGALADLGFHGVDKPDDPDDLVIVTGYKATLARKLTPGQKQANRLLAAARAPVEHGFANLKAWRILTVCRRGSPNRRHRRARERLLCDRGPPDVCAVVPLLDNRDPVGEHGGGQRAGDAGQDSLGEGRQALRRRRCRRSTCAGTRCDPAGRQSRCRPSPG
ncbi:transposase family protein [Streptomyces sp. NPDC051742]|uniref:transposase family protein n=1 Tax=unclassified Streptomyces TaxID=2593676 RepID=UPI0034405A7B